MARDRNGRMRHVVVLGSTTVNDGVKLVDNREYPQIVSDFRKSFRVQKGLTCEVFLSAHASAFNGLEKAKASAGGKGEDAFIDPQGCRAAIERWWRACHYSARAKHIAFRPLRAYMTRNLGSLT